MKGEFCSVFPGQRQNNYNNISFSLSKERKNAHLLQEKNSVLKEELIKNGSS